MAISFDRVVYLRVGRIHAAAFGWQCCPPPSCTYWDARRPVFSSTRRYPSVSESPGKFGCLPLLWSVVHPFNPHGSQQHQRQQQNARPNATNPSFPTGFNPVPASPNPGSSATDPPQAFFNGGHMNPNAAKQMAVLSAASLARRAQATRPSPLPGGPTSASFLRGGGLPSVNQQQQSPSPAPGHDHLSALSSQGRMSFQEQSMNPQLVPNQPTNFGQSSSDPFMSTTGL